MISHITISVNEAGWWVVNVGDVTTTTLHTEGDVRRWVAYYLDKLAFFPAGKYDLCQEPRPGSVLRNRAGPPPNKRRHSPDEDDE